MSPTHQRSLVFLAVVGQDQIFELHFHLDPLLISQSGPDMVWLCNSRLVWLQDHLCPVIVHVQGTQNQDEAGESLRRGMATKGGGSDTEVLPVSSILFFQGTQKLISNSKVEPPPLSQSTFYAEHRIAVSSTG